MIVKNILYFSHVSFDQNNLTKSINTIHAKVGFHFASAITPSTSWKRFC